MNTWCSNLEIDFQSRFITFFTDKINWNSTKISKSLLGFGSKPSTRKHKSSFSLVIQDPAPFPASKYFFYKKNGCHVIDPLHYKHHNLDRPFKAKWPKVIFKTLVSDRPRWTIPCVSLINITCTVFYRHTKSHVSFFLHLDSILEIQLQVCSIGISLSHYFTPLFFVLVFGCNLIFTAWFGLQNSF